MQNPWGSKPLCNQLSSQKGIKDPKWNHKSKDMFVTERGWKKIVSKHVQKEFILVLLHVQQAKACIFDKKNDQKNKYLIETSFVKLSLND